MSRTPARFTEADAYRAAKAAKRAGMAVEIGPDGVIRIVPLEILTHGQLDTLPPQPEPKKEIRLW